MSVCRVEIMFVVNSANLELLKSLDQPLSYDVIVSPLNANWVDYVGISGKEWVAYDILYC